MSRKQLNNAALIILCMISGLSSCQKDENPETGTGSVEGGCTYYVGHVPEAVFTMDSIPDHYNAHDTIFLKGSISGLQLEQVYFVTLKTSPDEEVLYSTSFYNTYQICDTIVLTTPTPESLILKVSIRQFQPPSGSSYGCGKTVGVDWIKTVTIN